MEPGIYVKGASENDHDEVTGNNGIYRLHLNADSRAQFHAGLDGASEEMVILGIITLAPVITNPEPSRNPSLTRPVAPVTNEEPRPSASTAASDQSSESCLFLLSVGCTRLKFSAHNSVYGIRLFFEIYKIHRFTRPTSSRDLHL